MKLKNINTKKKPVVLIDKSLDFFNDKVLFPKKIHVSDNDDTVRRYKNVFRAMVNSNGQLGHFNRMVGCEIEENKTT